MAATICGGANDIFDMEQVNFHDLVAAELVCARAKYQHNFIDPRDGMRVVRDEYIETMVKVFKLRPNNDILHDLVQIAAMCQRTAEDCKMMEGK